MQDPATTPHQDHINYTPISLSPSQASWAEQFNRRAGELRQALGDVARRVDHVGSTAVPGLDAKPTIDIQIAVDVLDDLDSYRQPLERLGYTFHDRSLGDIDHRFFSATDRAAHVHVCPSGSKWERGHLLFRDYLRAHPDAARAYSRLKRELGDTHPDDRTAYNKAKTNFITKQMVLAEQWAENIGWRPADSSAGGRS